MEGEHVKLQVSAVQDDITHVAADLLLLKHSQAFYGADETVARRLIQQGICPEEQLAPEEGESALVDTGGAIAAARVLFLGTPRLGKFRYREMQLFARRAIEIIARRSVPVRTLATTVHGAGTGLDIEESLRSLILGFQQGLAISPPAGLEQILFVERNPRRFEILHSRLAEVDLVIPDAAVAPAPPRSQEPEPGKKQCVFVAMPFSEEFEDVYQFGIYGAVRRCGYVCEKVDESLFAGSIVDRIMDGIRGAEFVIADLTTERPNVYLEVGFAWGIGRRVILVAKEGERLHFDLSHHKCLFYPRIGKLAESLEKTILEMFGPGGEREGNAEA